MVRERLGIEVPRREDIRVNVLGINHFTWITKASYRHIDLLPIFREFSAHYGESGYELEGESWRDSVFCSAHRVAFDLFETYGAIPAAGDRHLAEFLPGPYLKQPEVWKFHLTPIPFRKQDRAEKRQETERLIVQQRGVAEKASGEEGVNIIAALLGLGKLVTNVNMPNQARSQTFLYKPLSKQTHSSQGTVSSRFFPERFRKVWKCWLLGIYPIRRQWRTQV